MRRLGVIGGMGPLATALFFDMLTRLQDCPREQDYLDVFIYSKPSIPDRTAFILGHNADDPSEAMVEAGRALVAAGAQVLAVPCVTAHFFIGQLTQSLDVPVINIIEETAQHIADRGVKCAGLMASEGTVAAGLFDDALARRGIKAVLPAAEGQAVITQAIYGAVKQNKAADGFAFMQVAKELGQRGAQTVILGCTELSIIKRDFGLGAGYTDALEVLARRAILECGGVLRMSVHAH